jgi:hypothetical protein
MTPGAFSCGGSLRDLESYALRPSGNVWTASRERVQRTFPDFEDFWTISLSAPSMRSVIAATAPNDIELLKARVRARLPVDATGRITYSARANAVKGRVPS